MAKNKSAYARAGVDIDEMMTGLNDVKRMVKETSTPGVLSDIGSFGGLFASPGADSVLVASSDGVGTKLKVAALAHRHDTVGQDLVNHCVNDILVQGARPLFFLDYVGAAKLQSGVFQEVVKGLCIACKENGCALLGGETAEMPGLYPPGEYDLVGTVVGAVERDKIITGESIRPGNVLIGLESSGLQTNGYSLARQIIFEAARLGINDPFPGIQGTVADVLLAVHGSYLQPVTALMEAVSIQGMAHITGGGLVDNVPRILPANTCAVIDRASWTVPAIFDYLMRRGAVERDEMYRVFNMGIGYVVIVDGAEADRALDLLSENGARAMRIGHIEEGEGGVRMVG